MKKLYGKLATVLLCGLSAFSVYALEFGLMRIPDSLAPCREEIVDGVGYANAVSIQLPGGGSMMLQNETGGGVMSSPIPVHAVEAVGGFLEKFQKNKSIAAEVSGTTWFACALEEADFAGQRCSFFEGPIVVKGYCFVLYLRTPADRGLDASVRAVLRQVTLLPPEDGNSEPTIPLVKMDLAKVPPVKDIPEWAEIAEAHKRTVETAAKAEDQPPDSTAPKAVSLPPLPAVVTAPKARTVKPLVSDDFMNASTRKAAIAHVRESLRELIGPMSDEENAAFEKRWNAVSDYPAPEILGWLKKASPIISELVRLKASVDAGIVACDDALREAAYAHTFGNAEAEYALMCTYAESLTALKTAQARMNELQKQLDELGEMPDPEELKAADRRVVIEAEQAVRDLVGSSGKDEGSPMSSDVPVAETGEYWVMTRTILWGGKDQVEDDGRGIEHKGDAIAHIPRLNDYINQGFLKSASNVRKEGCAHELKFNGHQIDYNESYTLLAWDTIRQNGRSVKVNERTADRCSLAYQARWTIPRIVKFGEPMSLSLVGSLSLQESIKRTKDNSFTVTISGGIVLESGLPLTSHPSVDFAKDSNAAFTVMLNRMIKQPTVILRFCEVPRWWDGKPVHDGLKSCEVHFVFERKLLTAEAAASVLADEVQIGTPPEQKTEDPGETSEERAESIAFHQQNITFIEGTISRLQKELAGEKDPSRRSALEWQIVCERSSVIYEQDRIRAEETGTFTASRTPFDEMCQVQQRENTRRQIQEAERLNRARSRVESLMGKMPAVEWDATDRIMDKINAEDPLDTEQWIKLGDALEKKYMGRLEYAQGMAESDVADREESLRRAETLKNGCDLLLAMGGAAGAPRAISLVYQLGTGFMDDGVKGAAKNAVCFYCDAIDIGWSAYDGYREGGLEGALKGAGWSAILNKGVPLLMGKIQGKLNTDVRDLFGGKGKVIASAKVKTGASAKSKADGSSAKGAAAKADASADVKEYKAAQAKADEEISEFIRAQNAFNQAELEHMSDRELTKIKSALTVATARVNANPTAKARLKYDSAYEKTGEAFDKTLGRIHETLKTKFYADMKAKGFNDQEIVQFRNASSKGTVGMDADWGLKETPGMVITKNGKRVSVYEWQREATESWDRLYKQGTGFDAQKSWENQTTHVDPEAYRNKKILEFSKDADNMREILSAQSLSDAQQAFDVTRYKAETMLNGKDFPRLVYVREAVRGTAKDMKSKLIPALDVKIKDLRKTATALTKQGKSLSKTDARNLSRLEAAKAHYEAMMKTFDDIGTGKMSPEEWDDAIRTETGGLGLGEAINDMADMFKSLVF